MNILAENLPDVLPQFLLARMNGDTFYNDVVVIIVDPGDLVSGVFETFGAMIGKNGKIGVAVFILPVELASDTPGNPSTGPLDVKVRFHIWENRAVNKGSVNGTMKRGYEVARHTFALFKSFTVVGVCKNLVAEQNAIENISEPQNSGLRGFGLNFKGKEDDYEVIPKVTGLATTPPKVSNNNQPVSATTVVLSSPSVSGSVIWFTTDGSSPPDPNGSATQGSNLVTGSPVYDGSGHYAVTVTNGLSYVIQDANGNFLSNVVASGSTYTLTGTAGAAVTQQMFLAAAQKYVSPITLASGLTTIFFQATATIASGASDNYLPSDIISVTFTH